MSYTKNFVLKQSSNYVKRIIEGSKKYNESIYKSHLRINWSYKYDNEFLESEYNTFLKKPNLYLNNERITEEADLADIFEKKLSISEIFRISAKIIIHFAFQSLSILFRKKSVNKAYRKCYVDDIDSVYENKSRDFIKWIYPFPIGFKRQIRFIIKCRKEKRHWTLAGLPYSLSDYLKLIIKRDFFAYMKLEVRAQLKHVKKLNNLGYKRFELSDEFDIGSLIFCKYARHLGIEVINSAHGIGKYLPVHAYSQFNVITEKQASYYISVRPTVYVKYLLNKRKADTFINIKNNFNIENGLNVILISSISYSSSVEYELHAAEEEISSILCKNYNDNSRINLYYRPHPNVRKLKIPKGFRLAPDLKFIIDEKSIILSFNSTCHVDPTFEGDKILVNSDGLYPEEMLGSEFFILNSHKIIDYINQRIFD